MTMIGDIAIVYHVSICILMTAFDAYQLEFFLATVDQILGSITLPDIVYYSKVTCKLLFI